MTTNLTAKFQAHSQPPKQSFFLMGPRGSGKSTWLWSAFRDAQVIDLLSEEKYQQQQARPALFADEMRALKSGGWVVGRVRKGP